MFFADLYLAILTNCKWSGIIKKWNQLQASIFHVTIPLIFSLSYSGLTLCFFSQGGYWNYASGHADTVPKIKTKPVTIGFCALYIYYYIIIFIIYTYKYVNKSQRMPLNPLQLWQTWVLTLFKMQRFRLFLGQCGIGNNFWDSVPVQLLLSPAFVNREIMFHCVYML